jgi:hypothetical protein
VLRPSRARPLAATWVAMRLKSGKAEDSFWPGVGIRARIQGQSCNRARSPSTSLLPCPSSLRVLRLTKCVFLQAGQGLPLYAGLLIGRVEKV